MTGRASVRRGLTALAGLAAVSTLSVGTNRVAAAGPEGCRPNCVVLIEVDGLEPEDLTREKTPFLWALAHPQARGNDAASPAYAQVLAGRGGFLWQAGRSPMSAGTAPSALSLLTGANPEQHGVVADEFMVRNTGTDAKTSPLKPMQLSSSADASTSSALTYDGRKLGLTTAPVSLFDLIGNNDGTGPERSAAAFIGDPAVATLLSPELQTVTDELRWSPDSSDPGDPSLCPVPRTRPVEPAGAPSSSPPLCPARDADTLVNAQQKLDAAAAKHAPELTYIHLAELGRVKQLDGDPQEDSPSGDSPVKRALADLDAALAAFVSSYQNPGGNLADAYKRTIFMVAGSHGYEQTPPVNRVPDPDQPGVASADFAEWVTNNSPDQAGVLVPQGTIGTVYLPGASDAQLVAFAADVKAKGDGACAQECIGEVLFAHPVQGAASSAVLAGAHPGWYLDPFNPRTGRTGTGGDLIVTLKPGWAFGRAVGEAPATGQPTTPVQGGPTTPSKEVTNPYPASSGGPRNRAIALLMNGPAIAPTEGGGHAVADMGEDALEVKEAPERSCDAPPFAGVGFGQANNTETMADDANAPGHECQPETVDVPLTIAALFSLDVQPTQIAAQARFLNEALLPDVGFPKEEEVVEDAPPEDPPPPPDPEPVIIITNDVQIIPVRPPKDPFPYRGLLRRLRAGVTDTRGTTARRARRGTELSTIEVRGDFGRPLTRVRLTFYKRGRKPAGGGRRRLVAIARFKPFTVKRGPVKLRLRVPPQFAPTYLGLVVQELRSPAGTATVGRRGGGIVAIADAPLLHTRARRTKRG